MKRYAWAWLLLALAAPVAAEPAPARALVYLSPQLYSHEVKLWHFYYSYWFSQGEAIEPVALEELSRMFGEVGLCLSNEAADVVLWIRPHMFYNPHFTAFYGRVEANVYAGSGEFIAAFDVSAKRIAYLDVMPETQVRETYRVALQELLRQMQANPAVQAAAQGLPADRTASPCSIVTVLPAMRGN